MDKSLLNFTASPESLRWEYSNLNFGEYLLWNEELIKKSRCDLTFKDEQKIINANKPFEFKPTTATKHGILLIHGLLSCPFAMHDLGQHLVKRGFLVRSILLPGHGTRPGDLRDINLEDWLATVEFGLNSLKQDVTHLWVSGLSGGASLAILSTLIRKDIEGLLLFAPSIRLSNPLARFSPLINQLNMRFGWDYWPDLDQEVDYTKYHSYPVHFATQAYRLTQTLRRMLKKQSVTCPVWMAMSEDDETVSVKAVLSFFQHCSNPQNRLLWYAKKAPPTKNKRIIYRPSSFPSENVLDFSHACLTFSPHNSHYGIEGDYLAPLHVPVNLLTDYIVYHGALTRYNLKHYAMRRLLYNPDFIGMTQELDKFITAVLSHE
ncbi:MAG: alpha/beta hydrolase [Gammaproteobacteria bacterium]